MSDGKGGVSRLARSGPMKVTRERKAVTRLLRGDDLELVSRELSVAAAIESTTSVSVHPSF